MRLTSLTVLAVIALAVGGRGQFNNITGLSGLIIAPIPPGTLHEGRGSAWADYNGDGFVDVIVAGGMGQPVRMFTNDGTGFFSPVIVHPATNLATFACVAADFDNDGDTDIFIAVASGQPNLLLVNDGTGTFTEEAALRGVAVSSGSGDSRCATWGDLNRDGWLDLYVGDVHYTSPSGISPSTNSLYLSDGAGSFTDISAVGGAPGLGDTLATLFHDYDGDGWMDIYNANDRGDMVVPDQLYVNQKYAPFVDKAPAMNADAAIDGMGIGVGDLENDGDWDVIITNREGPVLLDFDSATNAYKPPIGGDYTARATAAGLFALQVGWAPLLFDYDHDGLLDLLVMYANLTNRIYHGTSSGVFTDETIPQGIATNTLPEFSASLVDVDRDGDLDVFMPGGTSASTLIRNDNPTGNYLILDPEGTVSNRDALGLTVIITVGNVKQRRMLVSGEGYLSDGEKILHFGVGAATQIDEVELRWPSGTVNYMTNVGVNQRIKVVEPQVTFNPSPAVGVVAAGNFFAPEDAGLLGIVGFTFNPAGEYYLPDGRSIRIPVSDPVFQATAAPSNPWLLGSFGQMTAAGMPIAWPLPASWVALTGFSVQFMAVTISPFATGFVRTIHGPKTIVIQ